MNLAKKITLIWVLALVGKYILFASLPNAGIDTNGMLLQALMLLLGIVCASIYIKEPSNVNKFFFLNFTIFFLYSSFSFLLSFVGYAICPGNPWASFYFYQYHTLIYFFLLATTVVFVVIDSLFNDLKVYKKYVFTLLIVGGVFAYYNHPFFENPNYLYSTEYAADYKAVSQASADLDALGKVSPTPQEIASVIQMGVWETGTQVGILFDEQKLQRVVELLPYLQTDDGYVPLLDRPLFLNNIYMSVLCVVFIFLFFGYQYRNDPPQGAYIEKIVFLLLPYCSLEILHHYAYIKSVEYATLVDVQQIGNYLTLLNLVFLLVFFGLRLRFITSVKGEFYERELVSDAEHISRWRDAFDNLVVRHFLNPKAVHGRLFAPRPPRNEA